MAQKRMFDRAIIDTDRFMDLPVSAKAMYFLLGMEADDEGFVSSRKVVRVYGGNDDDVKVLSAKGFVIPFKGGVVVITDWNQNNYLDINRRKQTQYQEERKKLILTDNGKYELNVGLTTVKQVFNQRSGEERSTVENSTEEKALRATQKTRNEEQKQLVDTSVVVSKLAPWRK